MMKTLTMTLTEDEVRTIETALVNLHDLALQDGNALAVNYTEAIYKALKQGIIRGGG
jgi:hypothetical protein